MKSIFVYEVAPSNDEAWWQCQCGCTFFHVVKNKGYLCVNCGLYQVF